MEFLKGSKMSARLTKEVVQAAGVHALTASGALCALYSLQAIFAERPKVALLWLVLALVIDGVDGPLARRYDVKTHMPFIDGELLDLIVDFLTYVFVPVVFIWHFDLFPQAWEFILFAGILMSSLYLFTYTHMKESDNFFNGFPSAWNLVLFGWFILDTGPVFNAALTVFLCVLTFVPIKSVHPIRVDRFYRINVAMVTGWVGLTALLIAWKGEPHALHALLMILWGLATFYFPGISLWRTIKGREAWKKASEE